MDLTTATPAAIDTQLAALSHAEHILEGKRDAAAAAIHRGLGEKLESAGRGASRREWWPTSDADALAAMRSKGEELIGMMRPASSLVQRYDEAATALGEARDAQTPLVAEFSRRGGWTRFFEVAGGHIHRQQNCPTLHRGKSRTQLGWLIEMSGTDETKAIAELAAGAHILCSVCIPGAPVVTPAPRRTAAELAADRAAAERTARTEDPKLIAAPDGEPLRVDRTVLRTVRTAEIAAVDALWWAAYARHTGEPNEASATEHEGHAAAIVAALAHKNGTTPAAELARLTVKAVAKVKRDLGADVAAAAAAVWAAQAEAAAAPAPLTRQPEPQHAGRDDQDEAPAGLALVRLACGSSAREAVAVVRRALVAVGQVVRELDDRQLAELGRRLGTCRPVRADGQLDPFLAARLAQAEDGTGVRRCCTVDATDADCEQVHPGFTTPTAAYAAIAAEIEAETADPGGYLAAHLAAIDDDAAAVRAAKQATPGVRVLVIDRAPGADDYTPGDFGREIIDTACIRCGCTENRACPGGCAWATDAQILAAGLEPMDGDLCTACLPAGDVDLDDAAADDAGMAEVMAIAAAAPTVTLTDPDALFELILAYRAETAEAEAAALLALIARTLGVDTGQTPAAVPSPRTGEQPPAP